MWIKFRAQGSILENQINQKKKLNSEHCQFILDFFNKQENFGKIILELHSELMTYFNLAEGYISYWSLYDYVQKLSLVHKKITYKINRANYFSVKLKRAQIAEDIICAHFASFHFIYIDEISFNLELRPNKGWALIGKQLNATKPPKSKNYSVIVAMDVNGYLGIKIVKGGVKGPEFVSFMMELCNSVSHNMSLKNVIFFMDNASVHKSKDFMQKFSKYHNVLYNAAYTLNLIQLNFHFLN